MTPAAIIALVRDVAIVGGLAFIIWWIHTDGANSVKVADLQAVQQQITANNQKQAQWAQESSDAQTQHTQDLAKISALVASHATQPIIVRLPASPGPVSDTATHASTQPSSGGPTDPGSGKPAQSINIREGLSVFESRYETELADCRAAIAIWPR
jgi:hypothetical protein